MRSFIHYLIIKSPLERGSKGVLMNTNKNINSLNYIMIKETHPLPPSQEGGMQVIYHLI